MAHRNIVADKYEGGRKVQYSRLEKSGHQMYEMCIVVEVLCTECNDATLSVGIMTNRVYFIVPECPRHLDAECEKIL